MSETVVTATPKGNPGTEHEGGIKTDMGPDTAVRQVGPRTVSSGGPVDRLEDNSPRHAPLRPSDVAPARAAVSVGDVVMYRMSVADVDVIHARRAHHSVWIDEQREDPSAVSEGAVHAMIVTRVGQAPYVEPIERHPQGATAGVRPLNAPEEGPLVNGTVFLDGHDNYWACGVAQGDGNGQWYLRETPAAPRVDAGGPYVNSPATRQRTTQGSTAGVRR